MPFIDGDLPSSPELMKFNDEGLIACVAGLLNVDLIVINFQAEPRQLFDLASDRDEMQRLLFNHAFADKVTHCKRAISMRSGIDRGLTPKSDSEGPSTVFFVLPCERAIIIHKIMS